MNGKADNDRKGSTAMTQTEDIRDIGHVLGGRSEEFRHLVRRHRRDVVALVGRMVARAEDVEEVVQDAFVEAYRSLPKYDARRATFATWLMRIAYHTAAHWLRRRRPTMVYIEESATAFGYRAWTTRGGMGADEGCDSIATQTTAVGTETTAEGTVVSFEGVRLNSLLARVASHYGRRVCFREEGIGALRIHTRWDTRQPLAVFLEDMNELDGLRLADERDTLFVWKGGAE